MAPSSDEAVEQRVLHGADFKQRWGELERGKRRQLQRVAALGEAAGNAADAALVAGFAWRQLRRLPIYIGVLFAVSLVVEFFSTTLGGADAPSLALFVLAGLVSFSRIVRRYSAALMLNGERGGKARKKART